MRRVVHERTVATGAPAWLAALAIDVDDITADLQRAGVASFASAFESLLASIDAKRAAL